MPKPMPRKKMPKKKKDAYARVSIPMYWTLTADGTATPTTPNDPDAWIQLRIYPDGRVRADFGQEKKTPKEIATYLWIATCWLDDVDGHAGCGVHKAECMGCLTEALEKR